MSFGDIPPETVAHHEVAVKVMTIVGFVALIYDHALTLLDEIQLIWTSRPGIVSVLFLLNRYMTPILLIVDIYEMFGLPDGSEAFCKYWTALQSFFTYASFLTIHAIVALRVYAIFSGSRFIKYSLCFLGGLYAVSSATIIVVCAIKVIPDISPPSHGCVRDVPSYLWVAWLPSVIFESIIFGLTVVGMILQDRRRSFNALALILYRDGLLYFVAVASCSLFSLLVWALAPPTLLGLARYFALAMVNVSASRMVLNLKTFAAEQNEIRDRKIPASSARTGLVYKMQDMEALPRLEFAPASTSSSVPAPEYEMLTIDGDDHPPFYAL